MIQLLTRPSFHKYNSVHTLLQFLTRPHLLQLPTYQTVSSSGFLPPRTPDAGRLTLSGIVPSLGEGDSARAAPPRSLTSFLLLVTLSKKVPQTSAPSSLLVLLVLSTRRAALRDALVLDRHDHPTSDGLCLGLAHVPLCTDRFPRSGPPPPPTGLGSPSTRK